MRSSRFSEHNKITNSNVEEELRKRLCYEKMLADVSSLAVSVKDLRSFMDACLERMGNSYDTSRIYEKTASTFGPETMCCLATYALI